MILRRRGILLGIGILALATLSAAVAIQAYYFRLPDPEVADGRGLIRWMVTRDLSQETPDLRRRLLVRVKEVLGGREVGSGSIDEKLAPKYRAQFWRNVDTLLEEWFHVQAEHFAAAKPEDRPQLLDEILDEAQRYGKLRPASSRSGSEVDMGKPEAMTISTEVEPAAESSDDSADVLSAAANFIQKMNTWIERSPSEKQPMLRHFAAQLQARMAVRSWQKLMGSWKSEQT